MCTPMCEIHILRLNQDKISKAVTKKTPKTLVEKADEIFFSKLSHKQAKRKAFFLFRHEKKTKLRSNGKPFFYSQMKGYLNIFWLLGKKKDEYQHFI